jgi:hypothetical protein
MTEADLRRIARRAANARLGMDAYATAVEEHAAEACNDGAWREAAAIRHLIADVPALIAEVRRLQERRPGPVWDG